MGGATPAKHGDDIMIKIQREALTWWQILTVGVLFVSGEAHRRPGLWYRRHARGLDRKPPAGVALH